MCPTWTRLDPKPGHVKSLTLRASSTDNDIPKYHVNLFWSEPDGAWVADVPDLQSCSAFGDTPAEALAEIEQAIEAWLAVARENGLPIPKPGYSAPTRAAG